MNTVRQASCHCGQLKVACQGDPVRVSVCHCLACQQRTGSAFGVQARFPRECLSVTGQSKQYTRTGDSGGKVKFFFCPECGSTVFWHPEGLPAFAAVAVGAFADPTFPEPKVAVYEARQHGWVAIANIEEHWD